MADEPQHLGTLYLTLGDVIQMTGVIHPQNAAEVEGAIRKELEVRLGNAGYPQAQLVRVISDPERSQGYIATVTHADFPPAPRDGEVPVFTLLGAGTQWAVAWPHGPVQHPAQVEEPSNKPDQTTPEPRPQPLDRNRDTERLAREQRDALDRQRAAQTVPVVSETPARPPGSAPGAQRGQTPTRATDKEKEDDDTPETDKGKK